MSQGPSEDPGGSGPGVTEHSGNQELNDLKDQFEHQQTLIAQLKEMLRKDDQTSVTQEKVAEYANTLTKMNARAKRNQNKEGGAKDIARKTIDTPSSEKMLLLRQQIEQNKVKLAERGKSQKGVEQRVLQMKAQLDDSQHFISQSTTPLNISLIEDRVDYSPSASSQELYNILLNKDKRITEMNMKMSKLEANVLDLQENLKEKDSVIDARTKAITLMSENLSKKSKTTLDTLDDTKEQMRKMQTNFIKLEEDMKEENCKLQNLLDEKNVEICQLKSENDSLVASKTELSKELDTYKESGENDLKLREKIAELEEMNRKLQSNESPRNSPSRNGKRNKRGRSKSGRPVEDNSEQITLLEKTIKELEKSVEEYDKTVKEYNTTIEDLKKEKEESNNIIKQLRSSTESSGADLQALKKQLDDSNKNMIKVKAQHKSKLKELNKKIDDFKKISNVNAELVKVESENSKLTQKIAELEEEKGQMQLQSNDLEEFEAKIKEHLETISVKNELILKLENVIQENEEQMNSLTSRVESLSNARSDKIQSDLTSVQFEEQLEKMEREQQEMLEGKALILQENKELKSKIEVLSKEKQEINSKLENYLQENMELIDRLEKLSAEKVSSAESIEIVENLTQQEKLELEAYQKNIMSKNMEQLEDNPELNESVNQLTEETSELLQRIELFTVERKEVMEKMEQLTQENNQLTFRIKEVENNRDVLVETYEQLQTEKEELDEKLTAMEDVEKTLTAKTDELEKYKSMIEDQKKEIEELYMKLQANQSADDESVAIRSELESLQKQYTHLLKENETLKNESEKFDDQNELKQCISDLESKLRNNLEEIHNYKSTMETNNVNLKEYEVIINEQKNKLSDMEIEMKNYKNEEAQLLDAINKLEENKRVELTFMSEQVEELKSILSENLDQMQKYDQELQANSDTIKSLTEELKQLNNKILETEHLLDCKDDEIKQVKREKDQISEESESKLKEQAITFNQKHEEMKLKFVQLQKQIDQNSGSLQPLEGKVQELEKKNRDQLEKMKKIAANLKKKTLDYKELETKYNDVSEKWMNEKKEKEEIVNEKESEWKLKIEQLDSDNESLKSTNSGLMSEISAYTAQVEDLQNVVREYETEINSFRNEIEAMKLSSNNSLNAELNNRDERIITLNEQLESLRYETDANSNALQMKIKELELFIESQNDELNNYKERVNRLEEGLSKVEERRLSLEGKAIQLGMQLEEKESCVVEASIKEANIEERLNALIKKDKLFNDRLNETLDENQELQAKKQHLLEENEQLRKSITLLETQLRSSNEEVEDVGKVSEENESLKNSVNHLEIEVHKLQNSLENMKSESEKNENELQEQIQEFNLERKKLLEECEMMNDQKNSWTQMQEEFSAKIAVLNEKLDQQQIEYNDITTKYSVLQTEYQMLLNNLEETSSKLQTVEADKNNMSAEIEEMHEVKTQLDFAKNMLKHVEENSLLVMTRNDQLEKKIEEFTTKKENKIDWPVLSQNPFEFVTEQPQTEQDVQSLHDKIKSLEFMLFTAEKEKENALMECHQMSSELTKVLYEKEKRGFVELESQIQQGGEIAISAEVKADLQQMQPVVEEVCVARKAYVCQPENQNMNAFGENDDGWAWGAEEAKLEQEHMENVGNGAAYYTQRIKELEANVMVLDLERESNMEELKQSQVKSGKLLKKLKEFKVKNDQLTAKLKSANSSDLGFKDLEDAMVDELKSQLETSEKKLKEIIAEFEKEKLEKANILKRVDVLTSANERMVEMKEKQDIEVMAWQRRNRELAEKLEKFEWDTDSFETSNTATQQTTDQGSPAHELKIKELNDVINELSIDNEELQSILEEQRTLLKEAQRAKSMEPISENMKTETEFNALLQKNNELLNELTTTQEKMNEVTQQLQMNYVKRTQLEACVMECNIMIEELQTKIKDNIDSLEIEKLELLEKNKDLSFEVDMLAEFKSQLEVVEFEKTTLFEELKVLKTTLQEKDNLLQHLESEKNNMIEVRNVQENEELNVVKASLQNALQEKQNLVELLESATSNMVEVSKLQENEEAFAQEKRDLLMKIEDLRNKESEYLREIEMLQGNIQRLDENSNELNIKLEDRDNEIVNLQKLKEEFVAQVSVLENDKSNLLAAAEEQKRLDALGDEHSSLVQELEDKILELQRKLENLENDYQSRLEQLQLEWSQHVEQRGNDVAESWKMHVDMREKEFVQTEQKLRNDLDSWEGKYNAMVNENNELKKNVDDEIRNEIEKMTALQKEVLEKQHQINDLTRVLQEKQTEIDSAHVQSNNYMAIIQQLNLNIEEAAKKAKDVEELHEEREAKIQLLNEKIMQLSERIQELEAESDELRQTVAIKEDAIARQDETIKELNTQIASSSDTENVVKTLQLELHEKQNELKENEIYLEDYKMQLEQYKSKIETLERSVLDRENELRAMQVEMQAEHASATNHQQQISMLNTQIEESRLLNENYSVELQRCTYELQCRDAELARINVAFTEREQEYASHLQAKSLEIECVSSQKMIEIEDLQDKLNEIRCKEEVLVSTETELRAYKQQLEEQQTEIANLQVNLQQEHEKLNERIVKIEYAEREITELQQIIESQQLTIEELKRDLLEKSSNYDALIAEVSEVQELSTARRQLQYEASSAADENLADPVNRAELDLALYMLHQRDVRCEELTVELMQLLEERDTLQLRLSNAIREKEDLRSRRTLEESDEEANVGQTKQVSQLGAIPKSRAIILGATGTEMATEAAESLEGGGGGALANKLSELKSVGYRKDKTILDEQDMRRIQQLSILQQHKDDVSKLPAEAAARLVDASYTLSRDVQSPSKVLLNWLWGKSTPKVNNV